MTCSPLRVAKSTISFESASIETSCPTNGSPFRVSRQRGPPFDGHEDGEKNETDGGGRGGRRVRPTEGGRADDRISTPAVGPIIVERSTPGINDVEPQTWLTDVLDRMANGHPVNQIDELLPWAWKAARSPRA